MNAQRTSWTIAVLLPGLLVFSGCGPSQEQQAIDTYNRGTVHLNAGEYDEAIDDFTEAIRLDPGLTDAYANRGFTHAKLGDTKKAIDDCTEAIRLAPGMAKAYANRGFAHVEQGEFEKAIDDCTAAIQLDPEIAGAYYFRGLARENSFRTAEAEADFAYAQKLGFVPPD